MDDLDWQFAGSAKNYTFWHLPKEDIYQVTSGRPPSSISGYHNLETLLRAKDVKPGEYHAGKRLTATILVHPGSACGSADFNLLKSDARAARTGIVNDLLTAPGPIFVIDSELSEELDEYPVFHQDIRRALLRAEANGFATERLLGEDASLFTQVDAALALVEKHGLDPRSVSINLTGAWYDDVSDSGCVNSVYEALAKKGFTVDVLDGAAVLSSSSPEDGMDEDDIACPSI